jgi:hypothetical protein
MWCVVGKEARKIEWGNGETTRAAIYERIEGKN